MTTMLAGFPVQPTMFVGRKKELAAIQQDLQNPGCRLLTLTGPGGVGKTRLAVQAGISLERDFNLGASFVNMQSVETIDHAVSVISEVLSVPLSGKNAPLIQLENYLRDKQLLLVLDNLDHFSDGADLVAKLIMNAPSVKIIVTSRHALQLQEEWLYPVRGLPYPQDKEVEDIGNFNAVQFFVGCAQRLRPDFSLEAEQSGIVRICQLVEGLPLALEMAASWVKTLNCMDIADEIQRDIEFLKTQLRNSPSHHRSMQAVIEQSWKTLSPVEQSIFTRLSVFRGGFDFHAARAVAGASLPVLSGLVDKSILRLEGGSRYHIHELIRQFAKNKLELSPNEAAQTQAQFGSHYVEFIYALEGDMMAGHQREATLEIKAEFENIRNAWGWAIATGNTEAIKKSVMALSLFYQYQSRYMEGNTMLEEAKAVLKNQTPSLQRDLILISVLCELGWLRIRLGNIDQAEKGLQESLALLEKHNVRPILGNRYDPRLPLGVIASIRGDYLETARLGEVVLVESQSRGEIWNEQLSYYLLTRAAILQGDFETAQVYGQRTYQLTENHQDHWFMAYCLNELGSIAQALGDYKTARGHFQASYELREAFDDPEGMAVALNHLGEIALQEVDFQGAQFHFQKSRKIYQEINDQGGLAVSLHGLARLALAKGEWVEARRCFLAALRISIQITYLSLTTTVLAGIAHLLLQAGETLEASRVLSFIVSHPASEREIIALAQGIAQKNKLDLSSSSEKIVDLGGYVTQLSAWMPALKLASISNTASPSPSQSLIDPLTERELEVLACIARGLTNQQIAETLIISPGTVKWYTSQIYSKLQVKNRTQAVARARGLELIP